MSSNEITCTSALNKNACFNLSSSCCKWNADTNSCVAANETLTKCESSVPLSLDVII